eukprot:Clim_evm2s47 gene=Clim_evmTU2s47
MVAASFVKRLTLLGIAFVVFGATVLVYNYYMSANSAPNSGDDDHGSSYYIELAQQWINRRDDVDPDTDTPQVPCRRTVESPTRAVDDHGRICTMDQIDSRGCCKGTADTDACSTCAPDSMCCGEYESCVACCMRYSNVEIGGYIRHAQKVVYLLTTDKFDFCRARCRTSSKSVHHENTYIDPNRRFCCDLNV